MCVGGRSHRQTGSRHQNARGDIPGQSAPGGRRDSRRRPCWPDSRLQRARSSRTESTFQSSMKILIAEDNAISQELLKKILVTRGHEVVVAADGRVAWDLLCAGLNPDLAILDIMMPSMSGLEVLQRI